MVAKTTHGMTNTRAFVTWHSMVNRCHQPNCKTYRTYGAKGITVCDRWRNSFENFFADMGHPPDGCSLDRIDNTLGYQPDNCRWATKREQQINRRNTVFLTLGEQTKALITWADELGISHITLTTRLNRGWTHERTLTTPVAKKGKRHE
jgi:hypothetical protein